MRVISLLMACVLSIAATAVAEQENQSITGKDWCLLDAAKCPGQIKYDLVEKIAHLKAALGSGAKLYSPQELEHLQHLLEEALETAEMVDADPSQVPENRFR
jgi:hypothetical protein